MVSQPNQSTKLHVKYFQLPYSIAFALFSTEMTVGSTVTYRVC